MADEDREDGLVMPFVAVASKGGPYDDDAYCAGWEMGKLDEALMVPVNAVHETTIRTANVAQADLIAMRHGFRLIAERSECPEWTYARFELIPDAGGTHA